MLGICFFLFQEIKQLTNPLTACILQVSDDGRYVLLSIREGCDPVNRLWYCDLKTTPQGITGVLQVFFMCTDCLF